MLPFFIMTMLEYGRYRFDTASSVARSCPQQSGHHIFRSIGYCLFINVGHGVHKKLGIAGLTLPMDEPAEKQDTVSPLT